MSWLTGGQHQTRQPGGPRCCARLPDLPDTPVGRPRADGPVGLQLGSADIPSHHPGGHRGPLASSITAAANLAVVPQGRGGHPSTTTQAGSTGSRPNPSPSPSSATHPRPSLSPSLDLTVCSVVPRAAFCTPRDRKRRPLSPSHAKTLVLFCPALTSVPGGL